MNSSARCITILAGLFFASRVEAQIDSNAHVIFYSGGFDAGCTMTITYVQIPDYKDTFTSSESANLDAGVSYDGTLSDRMVLASYPPNQFLTLSIDSIHRVLSIQYHKSAVQESDLESGEDDIQVTIDSIPYSSMPDRGLLCKGNFSAFYTFGSFRVLALHRDGGGNCFSQGESMDSIYLRIGPQEDSVTSMPIAQRIFFVSLNGTTTPLAFNDTKNRQDLDIFDVIGRRLAHFSNLEATSHIQIDWIPDGIYFAQFGTQVTKFIVSQ